MEYDVVVDQRVLEISLGKQYALFVGQRRAKPPSEVVALRDEAVRRIGVGMAGYAAAYVVEIAVDVDLQLAFVAQLVVDFGEVASVNENSYGYGRGVHT